ncbi:alpha/beta fold hydrolase [Fulvimarina endophytica]|uniref:Alpha/beta fold hydrolase n=1 Tax=Fulvimarina endophytica TaxID=2293836 RepID=A0A371X5T9_9HYPH|nr:alpha/beta fold hydrolase [Fulvimarina endophytica]RFC64404.1 alpha/beta fold hydrolase [Fulvimarina endophytica]
MIALRGNGSFEINLRVEGSGPPLLFLGGSNFDLSLSAPVFDSRLTECFTVAAYDPRGLGHSFAPAGRWTMKHYADDALRVLDHLGWETAYVLGESFGGMSALHLAVNSPERIAKLAVSATTAGGQGGGPYPIHELVAIEDARERAASVLTILDRRFSLLCENDPAAAEARIVGRLRREALFLNHANNRSGYDRLLQARRHHDCWMHLPSLKLPVIVIAGEFDDQAPLHRIEAMSDALPDARLHVFPDGHDVLFASEHPVETIIDAWT